MFKHVRVRNGSGVRKRVPLWLAGAVAVAVCVPGIAMSTVPPVHKANDLVSWITSPKTAPPRDYVQYSECQVQNRMPPMSQSQAAQYCDPPSSGGGSSSPPTYWTAYYTMEFVWKGKTYRHEVTVPFSSWPDRPSSSRLLVDKIQVEMTGPTNDPVLLDLQLYNGSKHTMNLCCGLFRHKPAYSIKNFNAGHLAASSGAQASGTFWFAQHSGDSMENPLDNFELPIVAKNVDRLQMSDGTCYTYDWQPYKCTGYITIKPV